MKKHRPSCHYNPETYPKANREHSWDYVNDLKCRCICTCPEEPKKPDSGHDPENRACDKNMLIAMDGSETPCTCSPSNYLKDYEPKINYSSNSTRRKCEKCGRESDVVNMGECPFCVSKPPIVEDWEQDFWQMTYKMAGGCNIDYLLKLRDFIHTALSESYLAGQNSVREEVIKLLQNWDRFTCHTDKEHETVVDCPG